MDDVAYQTVRRDLPQRRVVVQVADEFPAQDRQVAHVQANGLPESPEEASCAMNGRKRATSASPKLGDGLHHLRFRNAHRADVSVYLANALVPDSDRVSIVAQRRDPSQRDITIDYTLRAGVGARQRAALEAGAVVSLFGLALAWRYRSSRSDSLRA